MKTYAALTEIDVQHLIKLMREKGTPRLKKIGEQLDAQIPDSNIGLELIGPDEEELEEDEIHETTI